MSAVLSLVRKSAYYTVNATRILKTQSGFKIAFTIFFALCLEAGLFLLFNDGFKFLHRMGGVGLIVISKLFALFFLGMGGMLVLSSIISSYSTIYRSDEITFLVTRPYTTSQIVIYKFLESTGLSSWAFFFIIIPFVAAYGYHEKISPAFAFWNLAFSLPFLIICSGIGTVITMIFARFVPLGRCLRYTGIVLAVGAAFLFIYELRKYRYLAADAEMNLAMLLPGFTLSSNPLLPSWWIAEGIMDLTRGQWIRGSLFLGLTVLTALMTCIIIELIGAMIFYDGWQRLAGASANKRRPPLRFQSLQKMLEHIPHDIRAVIMKDIRIFIRDPVQWSQALIFFGLLALYFANLRTFRYHTFPDNWRNTIAFLNIFSVSAVICSLGSRFIYPQLSLEGQGFWIIGLSPARMSKILLTKFYMSLACITLTSTGLMLLSSGMLNATPFITGISIILACSISCAVCGLSTGLGAIYMDLNQKNPAAIVSGFGGTLNLVLSLGFMLAAILPFGIVLHTHIALQRSSIHRMPDNMFLAVLWLLILTAMAVIIPLRLGLKALLEREY